MSEVIKRFSPFNRLKPSSLIWLLVFTASIVVSGVVLSATMMRHARTELATQQANILIETMDSVRDYTSTQVGPVLLPASTMRFLPEGVPSYAAQQVFERLRQQPEYSQFSYKEATLNPTNLRDKADDFETDIVGTFQAGRNASTVTGFRKRPQGDFFYMAQAIRVSDPSCLQCHSTPDVAPRAMVDFYGTRHGFGWKLNEVIGAQVIYLPVAALSDPHQSLFIRVWMVFATVLALALATLQLCR